MKFAKVTELTNIFQSDCTLRTWITEHPFVYNYGRGSA